MSELETIRLVLSMGGQLHASISGGKDGQAMTKYLVKNGLPISSLIHCDLGRVEWPQSIQMCEKQAKEFGLPLNKLTRTDGLDLLAYWERRKNKLAGQNKPFWSSADNRYCTSDLKRAVADKYFTSVGCNLIVSCEGIRAQESKSRAKKSPLSIRKSKTSKFYSGMTVLEALANYNPNKRLTLNYYPIFHYSIEDVWGSYGMSSTDLVTARIIYKSTGVVPEWWKFHPAYVFGNDRVSCMFCVLACLGDLSCGAKHNPELLSTLISWEVETGFTFKNNWSLKNLLTQ